MAEPETAIANLIADNVAGYTYDTNVIDAHVRQTPLKAVFVFPVLSLRPSSYIGTVDQSDWMPEYQIRVRGEKNTYQTTLALARTIRDLVHHADLSATVTGFHECSVLQSDPIPIPYNSDTHPEFIVNVQLRITR